MSLPSQQPTCQLDILFFLDYLYDGTTQYNSSKFLTSLCPLTNTPKVSQRGSQTIYFWTTCTNVLREPQVDFAYYSTSLNNQGHSNLVHPHHPNHHSLVKLLPLQGYPAPQPMSLQLHHYVDIFHWRHNAPLQLSKTPKRNSTHRLSPKSPQSPLPQP